MSEANLNVTHSQILKHPFEILSNGNEIMQKPIDHFQQPILGSQENLKLKTQILFAHIQQKNHYKYKCKIAPIQLRAQRGTEGLVCVRSTVVGNS